jgi:hypothetical protein
VLDAEVIIGHRLDQSNRPLSCFAQKLGDSLDCRITRIDAGARLKGFCHR